MDLGLKGAAVCVSGGTKGMGREAALAFAREGARVAVSARGDDALNATVAQLREAGAPDAFGVQTDAGDLASIEALFAQIDARWGELHTLINMVGPTEPTPCANFADVPDERWQYYLNVGIMSVVRCTRCALPLMRKAGWGRVINISSTSARLGLPFEAPYMTAKGGLNALSKNMAWALAKEDILVNTVTPGVFRTEALRHFMEATGATSKYSPDNLEDVWSWMVGDMQAGRHAGAIGRVALPTEASSLLLLLGSRANTYIAGANISIDGGTDYSPG
jgi:NAD(P)-dependent dehydrogenase (short-subunit alcohol dehydrogenase family)